MKSSHNSPSIIKLLNNHIWLIKWWCIQLNYDSIFDLGFIYKHHVLYTLFLLLVNLNSLVQTTHIHLWEFEAHQKFFSLFIFAISSDIWPWHTLILITHIHDFFFLFCLVFIRYMYICNISSCKREETQKYWERI